MKSKTCNLMPNRLPAGLFAILALAGGLWAANARADVEVARLWAATAPVIDGVVSPGEWNSATATTIAEGGTTYAQMRTMNDGTYLYVLLDVFFDTHTRNERGLFRIVLRQGPQLRGDAQRRFLLRNLPGWPALRQSHPVEPVC